MIYLIFTLINLSIYELNYHDFDAFNGINIFFFGRNEFQKLSFIRQIIIGYFGTFVIACIYIFLNKIKTMREQRDLLNKRRPCINTVILIYDDNKSKIEEKKISFFYNNYNFWMGF